MTFVLRIYYPSFVQKVKAAYSKPFYKIINNYDIIVPGRRSELSGDICGTVNGAIRTRNAAMYVAADRSGIAGNSISDLEKKT